MLIVVAILAGVALGFVGSIPAAGPLLLLVVASGLAADRHRALALAAGGALAESIYVLLAFWGLAGLLDRYAGALPVLRIASAVLLIGLGLLVVLRRPRKATPSARANAAGFVLGFSLVALNPAFLLSWSVVASAIYSSGVVGPGVLGAPYLALGAFVGIVLWFFFVASLAARYRDEFRPESLERAVRGVGFILVALGAWMLIPRWF